MTADIDPATVRHIASLARIDLDEEDANGFAEEFASILEHFDRLDEVPAVDRETDLTNVFRPDDIRESLEQGAALENAPASEDGYFKGPNVS